MDEGDPEARRREESIRKRGVSLHEPPVARNLTGRPTRVNSRPPPPSAALVVSSVATDPSGFSSGYHPATMGSRSSGVDISRSGDSPGLADLSPVLIDGDGAQLRSWGRGLVILGRPQAEVVEHLLDRERIGDVRDDAQLLTAAATDEGISAVDLRDQPRPARRAPLALRGWVRAWLLRLPCPTGAVCVGP